MRDENKNIIPLWGPYSKKYMGISRIMKESAVPGARFDLVIHPTYANSNVPAPNVTIRGIVIVMENIIDTAMSFFGKISYMQT